MKKFKFLSTNVEINGKAIFGQESKDNQQEDPKKDNEENKNE